MQWVDLARTTLDEHGVEALDPHLRYIHGVADTDPERIAEWVRAIGPDAEERRVTIAERLRQEGKREGLELGRTQGEQSVVELLLEERFGPLSAEARERLRGASTEQLERWARRVLHAASLDDVFAG